jgi:hypothetical protein
MILLCHSWSCIGRNEYQRTPETPACHVCSNTAHYSQAIESAQLPNNWKMNKENAVHVRDQVLVSYKEK